MAKRSWRRRRLREADDRHGPDHSEIVYRFDDGWTIRRPLLVADYWREGFLMHNCLREQDLPADDGTHLVGEFAWFDNDDPENPRVLTVVHSLRDPDNFPHVTFGHRDALTIHALGHAGSAPRETYLRRLDEWHNSLPYTTTFDELYARRDP